jgi:hypothetical protein
VQIRPEKAVSVNRSKLRSIILAMVVVAAVYLVYSFRSPIAVRVWHLRHGAATTVGNYSVPVPTSWYVEDRGDGEKLLVNLHTDDRTPLKRIKTHAGISIRAVIPVSIENLNRVTTLKMEFQKKQGAEPDLQRILNLDGDVLLCTGGKKLDSGGIPDIEPVAWNCRLPGGLEMTILATDPDMKQVWEIVSGIRKKS